ncbi:hypothetical protein KSS87_007008 [Heliosperma pusillum]|nr:hypothetical protein KSS87_007008 [Heliosperma pusillum]
MEPKEAEAMAVLVGLEEARSRGSRHVSIESDCLTVIMDLKNDMNGRSDIHLIYNDIYELYSHFDSCIRRNYNNVAHELAHLSPRVVVPLICMGRVLSPHYGCCRHLMYSPHDLTGYNLLRMTGSFRPRLRSEISRGHSHDDLSEGTSARTRPSSYDEIMRRRKSKKQTDGFKEEVQETQHARYEESVKNLDPPSRDSNTAGINFSRNHAGESGYEKMEEKSSRMEDIHSKSKNKESHDSRSKHNEKDVRNGMEAVKTVRRGYVSGKLDEEYRFVDSQSKHKHDKDVKSITEVSKYDRRDHASGRINEEGHDMDARSKEKHENLVKNSDSSLKADRRRNVRDKPESNYDMDSRSRHKHKSDSRNDTEVSRMDRRGHLSGRINEERRHMTVGSINKHEYSAKNSTPVFEANRRRNIPVKLSENWDMDSRSKHNNEKHVRSDTVGSKSDRLRHGNKRIDEDNHDMSAGRKDRHEKNAKNITPLVKSDTRGSVRDKRDQESLHVDNRAINKHVKHTSNSDEELKNSRQGLVRSNEGENLKDAAKYDNDVKTKRDYVAQNRYTERSRGESESEKKRKDRSADDEKYKLRDSAKKHDSGHRRDPEISERKEKEFLYSRHDESKSKRRRSRSLERPENKDRRPRSASPKARKNSLSHEHDYGPLSLQSQKERSKQNSDFDRSNMASNDSISHHRRHTGFSSGLGGYSPRKRKSDAAIKTPSPIRSPERNSAGRDLPSSDVDRNLSASVSSGSHLISQTMSSHNIDLATRTPVASSMGMPISTIFFHGLSTFQEPSIDSVQLTQATRPMRRLYVDNIPTSASEKEIMESFNSYLLSSGSIYVRGTRPCISCMINKEKGQALLEFLTPEYASAALNFNGRSLYGSVLKIRRPKDYVEMTSGSAERLKAKAGKSNAITDAPAIDVGKDVAISDIVQDSPNKYILLYNGFYVDQGGEENLPGSQIFVGGIADGLSSEMIMEIFSVLGPLKAFRFNTNKNVNEPCVFLEYADSSITLKACAALNGMKLGGRILTVAQATPDASFEENFETPPFYGIPEHVKPLLENPTLVLKLSNVLEQKLIELLPNLDLEEIVEDIRLECSRFGSVVSINAVITSNGHTSNSEEKEVNKEELPSQPPEERESVDHLNMNLMQQVATEHDGEANGDKPLTNLEGDKHDLGTVPANEAEASRMSPVDVKEAEPSVLLDCADIAVTGPQPIMTGLDEDTGMVKLGDSETCHADDVENLDKATGKQQEVARESIDSPVSNRTTETCEVSNVFEVGCILVEFKRIEASCMAAHCLHGRLFDDRIVTVEYVPVELYHARFPK